MAACVSFDLSLDVSEEKKEKEEEVWLKHI